MPSSLASVVGWFRPRLAARIKSVARDLEAVSLGDERSFFCVERMVVHLDRDILSRQIT